MDYTYVGSGTLTLYGCASFQTYYNILSLYSPGDILYIKRAAMNYGIMDAIGVKRVDVVGSSSNYIYTLVIQDTYNAFWNIGMSGFAPNPASPLVDFATAQALCIAYWTAKIETDLEYINCQLPYTG